MDIGSGPEKKWKKEINFSANLMLNLIDFCLIVYNVK